MTVAGDDDADDVATALPLVSHWEARECFRIR